MAQPAVGAENQWPGSLGGALTLDLKAKRPPGCLRKWHHLACHVPFFISVFAFLAATEDTCRSGRFPFARCFSFTLNTQTQFDKSE
jgi:hypothetical protein